jgi:hypothetical protein
MTDIRSTVRWAIQEYEALRTTYPAHGHRVPVQQLQREGQVSFDVFESVGENYQPGVPLACFGREFDPGEDLPVRWAVVTEGSCPAWLALEVSHLSADLAGGRILNHALALRLADRMSLHPGRGCQPADRTAAELAPDGMAASRKAVAYLDEILGSQTLPIFTPGWPGPGGGRLRSRIQMTSPVLGAAVSTISRRYRVPAATVYLAWMALLVGALSGRSRCTFGVAASNRWLPGAADYVGTLNQYALMTVDLTAAEFPLLLKRVQAVSLQGFGHALYNIDDLEAKGLLSALDQVDCIINNSQSGRAPTQIPANAAEDLRRLTLTEQVAPLSEPPAQIRRSIQLSVAGTGLRPSLLLCADPSVLPAGSLKGILLAVESLAIAMSSTGTASGHCALTAMRTALDAVITCTTLRE